MRRMTYDVVKFVVIICSVVSVCRCTAAEAELTAGTIAFLKEAKSHSDHYNYNNFTTIAHRSRYNKEPSQEAVEAWAKKTLIREPRDLIKKVVYAYDQIAIKEQQKYLKTAQTRLTHIKQIYHDAMCFELPAEFLSPIVTAYNELMKSKGWRCLRQRENPIHGPGHKQLSGAVSKLNQAVDMAYKQLLAIRVNEYTAWAQKNPQMAREHELDLKMKQLEKRVQSAEIAADDARLRADFAEARAEAAANEASSAWSAAKEAQDHANWLQWNNEWNKNNEWNN